MSGKNKWSDLEKETFTEEQIKQMKEQANEELKVYCKDCRHSEGRDSYWGHICIKEKTYTVKENYWEPAKEAKWNRRLCQHANANNNCSDFEPLKEEFGGDINLGQPCVEYAQKKPWWKFWSK